jgi:hypothetical protein
MPRSIPAILIKRWNPKTGRFHITHDVIWLLWLYYSNPVAATPFISDDPITIIISTTVPAGEHVDDDDDSDGHTTDTEEDKKKRSDDLKM